jgi:error-prone DNA polymerase
MERLRARLIDGMARNGIDGSIGERLYHMLSAFADYGFPESHAASFALIVYISGYLRRYYPAEFCASLLNAQPMGFYSPATLIGDARRHGVTVLPPDVNISRFECTAEPLGSASAPTAQAVALRIGLNQVRGIGEKHREMLEAERAKGLYGDLRDFVLRTQLSKDILESLAAVGAFGCFGMSRRAGLWDVQRLSSLDKGGGI